MITILGIFSKPSLLLGCNIWICLIFFFKCCLMSSDVGLHIRDKLRAMREHGSILLYVFMSTETMRLVRMDSPGRPPRLSHSSWTDAWSSKLRLYIYIYIPSMKYKKYWLSSLHHHEWWCNSFCSFILAPRIKIISPWSLPFLDSTTTVTHNCLSLNHCTNWHSMLHDTCCWHMIYICTAVANHLS